MMQHAINTTANAVHEMEKDHLDEIQEKTSLKLMNSSNSGKTAVMTPPEKTYMSFKVKSMRANSRSSSVTRMNQMAKVAPETIMEDKGISLNKMLSKRQLSETEMGQIGEAAEQLAQRQAMPVSKFLLNPNGWFRNRWDIVVIFALLFVATVTPFEVAFLPESGVGLMVINRAIDVIFGIDIFLNFITPFQSRSGVYISDLRSIAYNYMTSWFLIDLISVLPFEMLRMIRLLRLAKLLRIFRASRVLKRWETRISISFGYITLAKFIIYMLLLSHWLACLFRMIPDFEQGEMNWMLAYFEGALGVSFDDQGPAEIYNAALYWSVMTATTIGYGDVVAKTNAERWFVIGAMMIGGGAYAYIVGSVCGLVASMGEMESKLHRKIDDLNAFMEEQKFPTDWRIKLREYFIYTAKKLRNDSYDALLMEMSPGMRGDIFRSINEQWVNLIPFVYVAEKYERKAFITILASLLQQEIFPPKEKIARPGEISRDLFIIKRGVVMINKSYFVPPELNNDPELVVIEMKHTLAAAEKLILTRGKVFGEDMVLTNARRRYHCMSFTYVEMLKLNRSDLYEIFEDDQFPETYVNFRKHVIRLAFRTKFVHIVKIIEAKRKASERLKLEQQEQDKEKALHELAETDLNAPVFAHPEVSHSAFAGKKHHHDNVPTMNTTSASDMEIASLRAELQSLRVFIEENLPRNNS